MSESTFRYDVTGQMLGLGSCSGNGRCSDPISFEFLNLARTMCFQNSKLCDMAPDWCRTPHTCMCMQEWNLFQVCICILRGYHRKRLDNPERRNPSDEVPFSTHQTKDIGRIVGACPHDTRYARRRTPQVDDQRCWFGPILIALDCWSDSLPQWPFWTRRGPSEHLWKTSRFRNQDSVLKCPRVGDDIIVDTQHAHD
jgi:hypothetical protein